MASTMEQTVGSPSRSVQSPSAGSSVNGGSSGQVIRLLNSIVDVCLVYGFDETCMRELEAEEGSISLCLEDVLSRDIKLQLLQILAPGQVYPERSAATNRRTYSVCSITSPGPGSGGGDDAMSQSNGCVSPRPCSTPPLDTSSSAQKEPHRKKFDVEMLGLSWDNLDAMHFFVFPEGARIYGENEDLKPSVIPLLLTNIQGEHSYAMGIRFSRPFFISKSEESRYYTLTPWSSSCQPPANSKLVYLPTACVLIAKRPHFKFMKDALSGFHHMLITEGEDVDFWEFLKDYSERIFLVPTPPVGHLAVECKLPGFTSCVTIHPPRDNSYLDIRLNYPFLCLDVDNVLKVISGILTEQTILFCSSLYPMLTYVIKCFLHYITPFIWRHSVVTILPHKLLELLDAPVTTMIGLPSAFREEKEFSRVENVVLVDLDHNSVTDDSLDTKLPSLPSEAVHTFKSRYAQLQKHSYATEELQRLSLLSYHDKQREKEDFEISCDDFLSNMFLELMVNLFSDVTDELLQSRVKYKEAVKNMPQEDQEFYHQTEATDMFTAFYQSRKQGTHRDSFTLFSERVKKYRRKKSDTEDAFNLSLVGARAGLRHSFVPQTSSGGLSITIPPAQTSIMSPSFRMFTAPPSYRQNHSIQGGNHQAVRLTYMGGAGGGGAGGGGSPAITPVNYTTSGSSIGLPTVAEDSVRVSPPTVGHMICTPPFARVELVRLELPSLGSEFKGRAQFVDEVIASLDEMQELTTVKAQCVYLRAFYQLCHHEIVNALDDFFDTLQRLEVSLVPDYKLLQGVLPYLSEQELGNMASRTYYKYLAPPKKKILESPGRHSTISSTFNLDKKLPKKTLNLNDFLKLVRQNAVATDAESASNLHRVLSQDRTTTVSPDTFKTFYEAWKVVIHETSTVELPGFELEEVRKGKQVKETVLAVANSIRTSFGTQSTLILTTFRLLVVTGFKTQQLADLRHSIRFEKFSYQYTAFIGTKSPGIRIEALGAPNDRYSMDGKKRKSVDQFMAFQDPLEREFWYHIIVEVQAGWKQSQNLKDPCVMETAGCHVILMNAINQSGLMDKYNHSQRFKVIQKLLCFQTKDVSEVSKDTVKRLQYRINPCHSETERQTVESLLYIPSLDPYDQSGQGKIWIGLGNGRLKVYDIEARCFESDIKITESRSGRSVRLSCLLLVGQHVWVGSFSRNIHILDAETVCHVSQISYLEDAPRDLELSQTENLVWALLLNGILLAWNPETRNQVTKIQVPISVGSHAYTTCTCFCIWRDHIWVGTNRGSIHVMDSKTGCKVHELFFPGGNRRPVEIKHLALSSEEEVWCSVYSTPKTEDSTFIAVFDPHSRDKLMQYSNLDSRVSIMLPVNNTMWCGTRSGKIYIFHSKTYAEGEDMPIILSAHNDIVRTMAMTDINLVVCGSGSNDGYATVWKTIDLP